LYNSLNNILFFFSAACFGSLALHPSAETIAAKLARETHVTKR
jgi:hypothetical protein